MLSSEVYAPLSLVYRSYISPLLFPSIEFKSKLFPSSSKATIPRSAPAFILPLPLQTHTASPPQMDLAYSTIHMQSVRTTYPPFMIFPSINHMALLIDANGL